MCVFVFTSRWREGPAHHTYTHTHTHTHTHTLPKESNQAHSTVPDE